MEAENFFYKLLPYALKVTAELSVPASVCLTQWAVESGFESENWIGHNNYAGITDGGPPNFKQYDTIDDFVTDYIQVLRLPYYTEILALVAQKADPSRILQALADSPWDAGHYGGDGSSLLSVYQTYRVSQYDPSLWAVPAWRWAVLRDIVDGTVPRGIASREQIVTILYRALVGEVR